jgi:ketosteroid isomerase-like protein
MPPIDSRVKLVRRLWEAVADGGLEAGFELTEPDMEWIPHAAGGRVLTSEDLLAFFREFQGDQHIAEALLYSVEELGEAVLASGAFRLKGGGGISDFQIHIVYEFDDERLVRATTYATQADARGAAARPAGG